MARIALMSVSDGRASVHRETESFSLGVQSGIEGVLRSRGHDVIVAADLVWSNRLAVSVGRELRDAHPDLTIISIPVWAFPHFTVLAASELMSPIALLATQDARYPGMVGMLAAAGALDQLGRAHARAWGDIKDPQVLHRLERRAAAGAVVRSLRGSTFGRVGGRPMGMYTAVSSSDQWMTQFGIDVEEIDQYELVRRAEAVDDAVTREGREWLEHHARAVHYDGAALTPALLERQLALYVAMGELIAEHGLDFCGIKGQPELTEHYCTTDVAEALLNDPYDWRGRKAPFVCSTEADMDAALTMQILKGLSGTPVLFADMRHYHSDLGVWDLCNSGQHATWFSARADNAEENWAHVQLFPEEFYFPAGGASVHHVAAPGEMTFARLSRLDGRYRMQVLRGSFESYSEEVNERLSQVSTYVWPHAFTRFDASHEEILSRYGSNHIHAVPGDFTDELREVCALLDVTYDGFGAAA